MPRADIFGEYFTAQENLEKKYGKRSIVLMMVGSFYEIYGVDLPNVDPPILLGQAEEAKNVLGMNMTRKSKARPHGRDNPYMVGFPDYALDEHIGKLLRANFTVGIYDQYDIENSKRKGRKLAHVYTPSTYVDDTQVDINSLIAVEISEYKSHVSREMLKKCHIAVLSLNTGKSFLLEAYDTAADNGRVESEVYRIIHTYSPREIVYCGPENSKFCKTLDLEQQKVHFREIPKEYYRSSYQNEFLLKIFPSTDNLLSPIEHLNLEKRGTVVPHFLMALQFAYEQDKMIVSKMQKPEFVESQKNLILNNDSIFQLNLIQPPGETCYTLLNILSKTKTPMGKRYLKAQLLSPIIDPIILNERYELIDKMKTKIRDYTELLRGVCDIEKKYRKMVINRLHPYELADMWNTFSNITGLLDLAKKLFKISRNVINDYGCFFTEYSGTFDFTTLKKSKLTDIRGNFFNSGIRPDIDALDTQLYAAKKILHDLAKAISRSIDPQNESLASVKSTNTEGYYIFLTKRRWSLVPHDFKYSFVYNGRSYTVNYSDFELINLTKEVKVRSSQIRTISTDILKHKERANQKILDAYHETIQHYIAEYGETLIKVCDIIARIDFTYAGAVTAKEYGYSRPEIIDCQNGESYIDVKELRHPIIERINENEEFITNDFSVGCNGHLGSLIYGLNLCGKSTSLRAMGTAIVMAQTGFYVAAHRFTFYPFRYLLSKMTIRDNLSKGQSTFMIEVLEIRDMLLRSGPNTLVLSDELCSSTESSSGHAIVAQTLSALTEKKSKFMFSTHLHELQMVPQIAENKAIKIFHFKVHVENNEIIFDRKIIPGGLTDLYGLEVAKALGLPANFVQGAFKIRDYLTGSSTQLLKTKASRYNSNVYVDKCTKCGSTKNLDTHHLRHQKDADEQGLIDGRFHKNKKFNLQVLCHECHEKEHRTF